MTNERPVRAAQSTLTHSAHMCVLTCVERGGVCVPEEWA